MSLEAISDTGSILHLHLENTMAERKLVRIQEKGQVTFPVGVRRRLGLKRRDLVAVIEMEDGALITRQEVVASKALDHIGQILRGQGLSLEE